MCAHSAQPEVGQFGQRAEAQAVGDQSAGVVADRRAVEVVGGA